jgi:hypothetical protein
LIVWPNAWHIQEFAEDFEYAEHSGWDPEAERLDREVIKTAAELLLEHRLSPRPTQVSAGYDGSLAFVWDYAEGWISLTVGPHSGLHLYYEINGDSWELMSGVQNPEIISRFHRAMHLITPKNRNIIIPPESPSSPYLVVA